MEVFFPAGGVLSMEDQGIGWLPLTCVVLYVASFGMGVGPVPWILLGELLPTPVRSIGASIVTSVFAIILFTVTNVSTRESVSAKQLLCSSRHSFLLLTASSPPAGIPRRGHRHRGGERLPHLRHLPTDPRSGRVPLRA